MSLLLTHFWPLLFLLCAGHALCDFPLQGTFLSLAKEGKVKGFPWQQAILAHSLIHAGMVLVLTHSVALALAEFVLHYVVDVLKVRTLLTVDEDQAIHYSAKAAWAIIACFGFVHRY